jgi:hypothetical protein
LFIPKLADAYVFIYNVLERQHMRHASPDSHRTKFALEIRTCGFDMHTRSMENLANPIPLKLYQTP